MERYFEWDDKKAAINYRKHGIRFDEAALAFDDPLAVSEQDRIENGEQRWQTIGMTSGCLLLLVAHTVRFEDEGIEVVRIISARRADRKERRRYEYG
ncbi:BrnT family toxin [Methylomonas sp. TEB]|uniref:BrnT family toxin n=1 Tax=Methylomonas sp. TEB TaxID=3398229 RepID=UPI0039F613BB